MQFEQRFQAFVNEIEENGWRVHGVEVYCDGRLACCWGDTAIHRFPVYSATKTVTSLAAGLAWDDGKLDLDTSVLAYLPFEAVQEMTAEQREAYRAITLKRLLSMSVSGYPFRPSGESWLKETLQIPLAHPETPSFEYSNVSAYLVGVAAACAVGEDLYTYLNKRLFEPLDINQPPCGRCPDGWFYGASQMALTVNELSRIGLLLANEGEYAGKRIVSKAYVRAATTIQQMNREGGYGYFIWKYRDGFSINGKWGQKCYVLPEKGFMITYLSDMEHGSGAVKASMEKWLLDW